VQNIGSLSFCLQKFKVLFNESRDNSKGGFQALQSLRSVAMETGFLALSYIFFQKKKVGGLVSIAKNMQKNNTR
jgi:hypothetical protein